MKKIPKSIFYLLFIFYFFLLNNLAGEELPKVACVKVEPKLVDLNNMNSGDTFTVDINIYGIPEYDGNLGGFEFRLYYNKSVVDIANDSDVVLDNFIFSTGRSGGQLGPQYEQPGDASWKQPDDSSLDKCVRCGAFTFGNQDGPSGDGCLYHITFTIQNSGNTQLWLNPDTNALMISTAGATQLPVDNVVHGNVSSGPEPQPDLVVIDKSEEWINPDDKSEGYRVLYTIKNQGDAQAGTSTTSLLIDETQVDTQTCPSLDPGETYQGTFSGPFTCTDGTDTIKICADSNNNVEESNETNNCKQNVWSCTEVLLDIRNGAGEAGSEDRKVEIWLNNVISISGIQVDICDASDYLNYDSVELTDRTSKFTFDFEDQESGCTRLILYSTSGDLIQPGNGPILILHYNVSAVADEHSCVEISPNNILIADENDNPIVASEDSGNFFFGIYGDIWPYDDQAGTVGDGFVDIFDVVRDIQIILGTYTPTPCEFVAGDTPTGFGSDCQAPDEDINISDVLEIIAKILNRPNCIDSY